MRLGPIEVKCIKSRTFALIKRGEKERKRERERGERGRSRQMNVVIIGQALANSFKDH